MTTAKVIIDAYNLMAYDAVGLAARDLAAGLDFLLRMQERAGFAWLSANLINTATGKPYFAPSISRKAGDLNIAVIGLTGSDAGPILTESDHADILPWTQTLPPLVATLAADNDILVLLSSCSPTENETIAKTLPDIHLIIQAGSGAPSYKPMRIGNALVCRTDKQGKFLGILQVNWQQSKVWHNNESEQLIMVKEKDLKGIISRINQYQERLPAERLPSHQGYQQLVKMRDQAQGELEQLKAESIRKRTNAGAASTFKNRLIPLTVSLPDDRSILALIKNQQQRKLHEAALP